VGPRGSPHWWIEFWSPSPPRPTRPMGSRPAPNFRPAPHSPAQSQRHCRDPSLGPSQEAGGGPCLQPTGVEPPGRGSPPWGSRRCVERCWLLEGRKTLELTLDFRGGISPKTMLFGPKTEKTKRVCPAMQAESSKAESSDGVGTDEPKAKRPGHGRNPASCYQGAEQIKVPHLPGNRNFSDSLPFLSPRFVAFTWRYRPVFLYSLHRASSMSSRRPGFLAFWILQTVVQAKTAGSP
jgi:hypothetical protein